MGNTANHDPLRPRKLLLHANEIGRLEQKIFEKGYTLVPTRMYFRGSRVKVEIGLARGKKQYDKRADMATRDAARDVQRALRQRDDDR
jgi:SsrA-binding protein